MPTTVASTSTPSSASSGRITCRPALSEKHAEARAARRPRRPPAVRDSEVATASSAPSAEQRDEPSSLSQARDGQQREHARAARSPRRRRRSRCPSRAPAAGRGLRLRLYVGPCPETPFATVDPFASSRAPRRRAAAGESFVWTVPTTPLASAITPRTMNSCAEPLLGADQHVAEEEERHPLELLAEAAEDLEDPERVRVEAPRPARTRRTRTPSPTAAAA